MAKKTIDKIVGASRDALLDLTQQLADGQISVKTWQRYAAEELKKLHTTAGLAAIDRHPTPQDREYIDDRVTNQIKYLFQFAGQIARGEVPQDETLLPRINMYVGAGEHTYENAKHRVSVDEGVRWERRILDPNADHCDMCLDQAALGWQPYGTLLPIGECSCLANCRCHFDRNSSAVAPGDEEIPPWPEEAPTKGEPEEILATISLPPGGVGAEPAKVLNIYRGGRWAEAVGHPGQGNLTLTQESRPRYQHIMQQRPAATAVSANPASAATPAVPASPPVKKSLPKQLWAGIRRWLGFSEDEFAPLDLAEFDDVVPYPLTSDAYEYREALRDYFSDDLSSFAAEKPGRKLHLDLTNALEATKPGSPMHAKAKERLYSWLKEKADQHGGHVKLTDEEMDAAAEGWLAGRVGLGMIFAKAVDFAADDSEGRWITIGASEGSDGKRHGGTPVFIKNGRIEKGHPSLVGKKIDALKEDAEPASHRKELQQSKEHARATWAKDAKKEGIDPKDLHQLAGEMLAHDAAHKSDVTKMLQEAREISKSKDYVDIRNLKARAVKGDVDPSHLKGFDQLEEAPFYFAVSWDALEENSKKIKQLEQRNADLVKEGGEVLNKLQAEKQCVDSLEQLRRDAVAERDAAMGVSFTPDDGTLIPVPDIVQHDHFSCGAAASMCVGRYYRVGPATLEEWKQALGTNVEESTRPTAIESYLTSLGLKVETFSDGSLETLRQYYDRGWPVICPVQDYGPEVPGKARFQYGHYLTVIGVFPDRVECQDSSEDNVTRKSGSIQMRGRISIAPDDWLKNWHDKDIDGNEYIRFGISVGPASEGTMNKVVMDKIDEAFSKIAQQSEQTTAMMHRLAQASAQMAKTVEQHTQALHEQAEFSKQPAVESTEVERDERGLIKRTIKTVRRK